ncbi:Uncharacterised protein [Enterobacter asburiae]|uniref:Uncharacterized protein n=1 Tax=Enterobacter asburiae TaxID=61645 RepID=A0A376FB60_ENTAS|nr:Uncharacterised protein [Enterobacter asburiae]
MIVRFGHELVEDLGQLPGLGLSAAEANADRQIERLVTPCKRMAGNGGSDTFSQFKTVLRVA